jgi:hypothetical protein
VTREIKVQKKIGLGKVVNNNMRTGAVHGAKREQSKRKTITSN